MEISKRVIRAIFVFSFKNRCQTVQTARDSNEMFGEEMKSECPARKQFKGLRSGNMGFEDRDRSRRLPGRRLSIKDRP